MTKLTFADLFSGCGGLSLGLTLSGLQGHFAVERDAMAFQTFAANMLEREGARRFDWPRWLEKRAWDIEELLDQHLGNLKALRGHIDILAGGPPCQGFSFAGRRNEDDPRNLLFKKYVEMVHAVQPRAIVIENVPGMRVVHARPNVIDLQNPKRPEKKLSFYDKLAESLSDAGYAVEAKLLDSSTFGVPQKRSRLIIIGVRKDLCEWLDGGVTRVFDLLEQTRIAQLRELGLGEIVTASDAISDLEISGRTLSPTTDPMLSPRYLEADYHGPKTPYQELMHFGHDGPMDSMRLARHRDDVSERFGQILAQCRRGVRMSDADRRSYNLKKHRIFPMAGNEPAPTVTTLPDDILHYSEPRILTVREYARLQSFPDWFHFRGKYTTGGKLRTKECPRYTQVGNAVPPLLARAIGKALQEVLAEVAAARDQFAMKTKADTPALAVG